MTTESKIPTTGQLVYAAGGSELGRVKEVDADCFKVDVPFHADCWVDFSSIDRISEGAVLLNISRDDLSIDKKYGMGHTGPHTHEAS